MNKNLIQILLLFILFDYPKDLSAQNIDSLRLIKAIQLMKMAEGEYLTIKDYRATIISSEWKGKKARETEYIQTRYLHPKHVYLKWLPGPYEGMQASYVPSRDRKMCFLAKETGLLGVIGTKKWCNNDQLIQLLYPHHFTIHQTNLAYLFETMQYILEKGTESGKLKISSIDETIDNQTCCPVTSVVVSLSKNPKDGLMWSKIQLFFDKKHKLPLHFILYDFEGDKSGDYVFTNFKKNIGIILSDFNLK